MMEKIRFKELSGWLKFAVVISFIMGAYMALLFLIGLVIGILEVI